MAGAMVKGVAASVAICVTYAMPKTGKTKKSRRICHVHMSGSYILFSFFTSYIFRPPQALSFAISDRPGCLQLNYVLFLLALFDQQLAVFEHIDCDDGFLVCDLLAADLDAALLDRTECFTVAALKTEILQQ